MPARRLNVPPPPKAKKNADAKAAKAAAPRGSTREAPDTAEELALLGPRDDGGPVNPVRIRRTVDEYLERTRTFDASAGLAAHDSGTTIVRLYRWHAEAVYGHERFHDFALRELGVKRSTMYRHLQVVRYATREQAKWGIERIVAVGRVIEKLARSAELRRRFGLAGPPAVIDDLRAVQFTLPDGRELKFAGKVTQTDVDELLLAIHEGRPVKRLASDFAQQNAAIEDAIHAHPKLRGTIARHRIKRGKRLFELSVPGNASLADALRTILATLDEA